MAIKCFIRSLFTTLAIISFNSNAAVIYEYTGNNFNEFLNTPSIFDTSMNVAGSFTVESKLISVNGDILDQITSYSFFDGVTTYTDSDPEGLAQFIVNTDNDGNIISWDVDIFDVDPRSPTLQIGDTYSRVVSIGNLVKIDQGSIHKCDIIADMCISIDPGSIDGGSIYNNPGAWSIVPIPAAIWLFGSGLLGLIGLARRKKA